MEKRLHIILLLMVELSLNNTGIGQDGPGRQGTT